MQQIAALLFVGLALAYLVVRTLRRRASGNCCGEPECPATKRTVQALRTRAPKTKNQ